MPTKESMTILQKIMIWLGVIVLCSAIGFMIWKQFEISKNQDKINSSLVEQKELANGIMRNMTQYVTSKDFEAFAKANNISLQTIQKDLDKFNAKADSITVINTNTPGSIGTGIPSTNTTPTPEPLPIDKYGYLKNIQHLKLDEPFKEQQLPFANVSFDASKEKPWGYEIFSRKYSTINVVGKDQDGKGYYYSKFMITTQGKTYEIKIDDAKTVQETPKATFSFWNPKLHIGFDAGLNLNSVQPSAIPMAGVSIFSYGLYKNNPDWTFAGVGAGYDLVSKKANLLITPAAYRLPIPLTTNTYIAPSLGISTSGEFSILGGIRVGL